MKTFVTLCAMLVCGLTLAGEPTSVLNHGTTTPAAAPAAAPTTAPVAASPAPAIVAVPRRNSCPNGRCQLYSVEEQARESARNRVFGGQVIRKGNRTVLRPVR